jgi:hypothetical protein
VFSDPDYLESKLLPFDRTHDVEWIEQYDYDSDSDLGYSSDDEHSKTSSTSSETSTSGNFPNNFQHLFANRPPDSDHSPFPITDETTDQSILDLPQQIADTKLDIDHSVLHHEKASLSCNNERVGKIVRVKDTAYITLVLLNLFLMKL